MLGLVPVIFETASVTFARDAAGMHRDAGMVRAPVVPGLTAPILSETQHVIEAVGLAAAWLLARSVRPRRRTRLSMS